MLNSKLDFLVQIIGLPETFRGKILEEQLDVRNIPHVSKLGIQISKSDFFEQKYHCDYVARNLIKREITQGEIACALAHEECYQRFLNSKEKYSIIFEDDARLTSHINFELIQKILDSSDPVVVLLGYDEKFSIKKEKSEWLSEEFFELLIPSVRAHAYALNKSAAIELIVRDKKLRVLADWPINAFERVRFVSLLPKVAETDEIKFNSEIDRISQRDQSHTLNYWSSFLKSVASLLNLSLFKFKDWKCLTFKQIFYMTIFRDFIYAVAKENNYKFNYKVLPKSLFFLEVLVDKFFSRRN